ncbi:hypothetical protein OROMI_020904 [Orobanche minor]
MEGGYNPMDYNDSDDESQNHELAGEESSKISSVLRPFALPKFDFDYSLQGHLRFDSLVENEVFLGIPSQEDNRWIEDFSRGGSGIEFSSSAAESCALPRHINVWSEATSSESVEMLLKAVGQEEMVPVEKLEESEPGSQLGSSTRQIENIGQDHQNGDVIYYENSLLPPAEVGGHFLRSNQSAGVEGVQTEFTVPAAETIVSSYVVCDDSNNGVLTMMTEELNIKLKRTSDNQEETRGLVIESLSTHAQESVPVLRTELGIDKTESSSQNVAASVKELVDQDKFTDISCESSSFLTRTIPHSVEEQEEGCNKDEVRFETDSTERHCSHEVPPEMESSKEEHSVEMCIANFGEASNVARKGELMLAEDGRSEVEFVVDPAGGSQHRTVVFSSSTEIKKNPEACSIFHEESSISLKREGIEGVEVQDHDAVNSTICGEIELRQVPDIQTSQNKSPVGSKYIPPGSHSCLEVPYVTFEVIGSPSDKVGESNHVNGLGNTIADRFCGKESVVDAMSDAGDTAAVQNENVENVDHAAPSLLAGSVQTSTEDIISRQLDSREDDLDVSVYGRDIRKLPLDSSDVAFDGNEMEVSTSSGERVKVDPATKSQPNSSASAYPALNTEVEDTRLTSSCGEGDELVESNEHNIPSCDTAFRDHKKETESEALKQPCTSVSEEPLLSNERSPDLETEKGTLLDYESGEIQKSTQDVLLVEPFNVSTPDEESGVTREKSGNKSCGKMENSSNDLTVQDDGAEAAPTEMPMRPDAGTDSEANSSIVSVTSCTIEMDKSNQVAPPDISCTDLPQSVTYKQISLGRGDVENTAEVLATSEISGITVSSKEEGTFTFDIRPSGGYSTGDSGRGLQPFPIIQACKLSLTGEGFLSTSGSSLTDPVLVKEVSDVSLLTPPSEGVIGPSERKARRASIKSGEASANKGSQVKEKTHFRQAERWEKSSQFLSPLGGGQLVTFESSVKPVGPVSTPTSSLPDLNTSAPSSAFFQQPFTDLQQVQLRAQIFVYGSLIQGAVPDEACMMSAFDGGRSFWEPSWRACVERLHGQKSHGKNTETPVSLRSGTKASDQTNRKGFPQIEAFTSMAGRASKKPIPSPCVNPMTSLSSPLWNISTPSAEALLPSTTARSAVTDYQAVSPLNPYETPPTRNYVAHTTWSSHSPFPVPWLASSQTSPYDISTIYPAFPNTAGHVKVNPSKESSPAVISSSKHASPIVTTHTGGSTTFAGVSSLHLKKKISTGQVTDTKTRKRKKSLGAEDAVQISVTSSVADTVSDPVVPSHLSNKGLAVEALSQLSLVARNLGTSVAGGTPSSFLQTGTTNRIFSMVSPLVTTDQCKRGDLSIDKRALNIECFSQVEEAKFQAQEAATHAAAAISQCQGVWSQLAQQKNTGLTMEAQSKLASAAVAVAAAASVAKAASAAAKIASTAALQAKQMADEAVTKSGTVNPTEHEAVLVSTSMNMVNESPVSILRGGDRQSAHSLAIFAAREAARKKVEAASAATRHAENLDAIVKAAELAAEAVSHAGKIVSMAEPFSLSELVEAGPNNYWKVLQVGTVTDLKSNDKNKSKCISIAAGEVPEAYMNHHEEPDKDMYVTSDVASPMQELSMVDDHVAVEENIIAFDKTGGDFKPQKDKKESDSANTIAVSHPDIESRSTSYALSSIKEGSYVEVLKDRGDLKKAWFAASVLNLKDGEALVSYTELQSDEGSEQLKEWISIEVKDGEAPKLRTPHHMTAVRFEGTRKRRRAVVKDYTWSIGDKVDAWVQDCWREGVIAEKNQKEATTLSVQFLEQEETLLVKVWHLRPTLIWSDGQWTEWCRPEQDPASEGDTPLEKRPKVGHSSICIEAKGKAKLAQNINFVEIGRNQVPRLPLSATEKVFNIGSTREEKMPNMVSSGAIKKEGPRVVFGVPKPGKKRKFMEVSKHYVSDRIANDPVKLARLLPPQGSGSRGFKNNTNPKLDLKDKQVSESRQRAIKSGKPPSIPCRTLSRKDDSTTSRPNARNAAVSDIGKGSISNDENESGEQNIAEFGSSSKVEETSGGTMVFSSQALPGDNCKKTATKNIKSGRLNQGKLAPASGRSSKKETNEKSTSEVSEPRRSNRRIQPTSRAIGRAPKFTVNLEDPFFS